MTEEQFRKAEELRDKKRRIEMILNGLDEPDRKVQIRTFASNIDISSYSYDKPIIEMVKRSYRGLLADVNKEFEAL